MATFTIGGRKYQITREELERRITSEAWLVTKKPTHVVEINRKEYPIKQVLLEITGLPENMVVPIDAYAVLINLGYNIKFCR